MGYAVIFYAYDSVERMILEGYYLVCRVIFVTLWFVWNVGVFSAEPLHVFVKSEAAILMSAETGTVLYEKNAYCQYDPASITKVATALYALRQQGGRLDEEVTAKQDLLGWVSADKKKRANYSLPAYWLEPGASHIGIKVGDKLSIRDLLYGMMLASGDDCANMIAQHVGGSVPKFVEQLNVYVRETLGCRGTHFVNPHGLFHPDHKTTAYDMAMITREALKDPLFRKIVKTLEYKRASKDPLAATPIWQTNKLLKPGKYRYPKAIGVKTGYLSVAQNTLVAAAEDGGRTLIAVLLRCEDRGDSFKDAIRLFDAAFKEPKLERCFLKKGPQPFKLMIEGTEVPVATYTRQNVRVFYYSSDNQPNQQHRCLLLWDDVVAPITKDQPVGKLLLIDAEGKLVQTTSLYAQNDVKLTWQANAEEYFLCQGKMILGCAALMCIVTLLAGMATQLYRKR